jgi:hypothetical protein
MSSNLPEPINRRLQSRRESLEARAQESAALEIYRHGLNEAIDRESLSPGVFDHHPPRSDRCDRPNGRPSPA